MVGGSTADVRGSISDLRAALGQVMLRDAERLGRRVDSSSHDHARLAALSREVAAAQERLAARRASVPQIRYPEGLPVSERRGDLAAAIEGSQVVVVAGETGSGKTTQLPKICLELGRGVRGMIGHTQPRRLAARSVAERIAEELGQPLGEAVGYSVRFHDEVGDQTLVKLMTDGILLAEIARDRMLLAYDTIILDEAHERSLNIDFLLGYLSTLLPKRPDLKLVITSATIDPGRFAAHFGGAPVVEVSGRGYPVEVRYRPPEPDVDPVEAIVEAVEELAGEPPGDVLVFLSGEREIRDTAEALRQSQPATTEVLPLFARLSVAEQHRVFAPHPGRRIVLATNVAETSLTVPGIRYVVDPGTARISRYSQRTKVQRLPIEPVSQASATQRAGRCGRVAPGVCLRLYAEDDLESRPAFTDPEILRTNLASVLLQMAALGLGDVASFPFVDPPDRRAIADGLDLLHELGATEERGSGSTRLTATGRALAQLPVDPRLARMVLEADRLGCVREVLVIVAALSIQDPRERPQDAAARAAQLHARFADPTSDFLAYLNLWRYLQEQQQELSGSAFRRLCRAEHLNYLRVREWQDLHSQLRRALRRLDLSLDAAKAGPDAVHQALLAGLLSRVGLKEGEAKDYLGARSARFVLAPGTSLSKQPRFVMVGELVETARLFGRVAARIDPAWVERAGAHLVKRQYSEPHWERKRAAVMAFERVTLYGIPVVTGRKVAFARVAPVLAREMFLRSAMVEGDWETHHRFFAANRELLEDVEQLEQRVRRRGLVVDDEALYAFYDARVPADVVSGRHFDAWWKSARQESPELLTLTVDDLVRGDAGVPDALEHPDVWVDGELRLPLGYVFEPGDPRDGVTVHVPVGVLNRLDAEQFGWLVPGLRHELVAALLRGLPKRLRVRIGPAPDAASALLTVLEPRRKPLLEALEDELLNTRRLDVRREDWNLAALPPHLRVTFAVEGEDGTVLAEGKDLGALRDRLRPAVQQTLRAAAPDLTRSGLTAFPTGGLPRTVSSGALQGFPTLVDEGASLGVRVVGSAAEQRQQMWQGTRRLLQLSLPAPQKAITGRLPNASKLQLSRAPAGANGTMQDCTSAALDLLIARAGGPAYDEDGFAALREAVRAELVPTVETAVRQVAELVPAWLEVQQALASAPPSVRAISLADMRAQLSALVPNDVASATGLDRLGELPRYLQGLAIRLDRAPRDPARDVLGTEQVGRVEAELAALREKVADSPDLVELRWGVEELRLSLFAQSVRTRYAVSEKRLYRAMDAVLAGSDRLPA